MSRHIITTVAAVLSLSVIGPACEQAQDIPSALELADLRAKAEVGDTSAQFNLGDMYDTGEGVPQDDAEAARWYRLAAEQGDADAQFNLGVMYDTGENAVLPHQHERAVERRQRGPRHSEAAQLVQLPGTPEPKALGLLRHMPRSSRDGQD